MVRWGPRRRTCRRLTSYRPRRPCTPRSRPDSHSNRRRRTTSTTHLARTTLTATRWYRRTATVTALQTSPTRCNRVSLADWTSRSNSSRPRLRTLITGTSLTSRMPHSGAHPGAPTSRKLEFHLELRHPSPISLIPVVSPIPLSFVPFRSSGRPSVQLNPIPPLARTSHFVIPPSLSTLIEKCYPSGSVLPFLVTVCQVSRSSCRCVSNPLSPFCIFTQDLCLVSFNRCIPL